MPRIFWNGEGELPADAVHFTNDDGTLQGRPYVRARVKQRLSQWSGLYSRKQRAAVLAATVDDDAWLGPKNGCLVSYVCREAVTHLLTHG